jgi:hypothetical protein
MFYTVPGQEIQLYNYITLTPWSKLLNKGLLQSVFLRSHGPEELLLEFANLVFYAFFHE